MSSHASNNESNYHNEANPSSLINFKNYRDVPVILQSEISECGLACIGMITSFYGHKVNLASLRNQFPVMNHGMSLKEIVDVASKLKLSSRPLKCDLEELKDLSLPAIIHWDLDHYVVLTSVKKNKITINDPARGVRVCSIDEVSDHYTGIALELSPISSFRRKDSRIQMKARDLWENIVGLKRNLGVLFSISVTLQMLLLTTPYYTQWIIDKVLINNDKTLLIVLAFSFSFLALLQVSVSSLRAWVVLRISSSLSIQMSANLFSHLIRLPVEYFMKRHVGDVVSRFSSLTSIREMITNDAIEILIDGIVAVIVIGLMFMYSPALSITIVCFLFVSFLVQWFFYYPRRKIEEQIINEEAREESVFLETLRAIQTIKLYNQENKRASIWLNRNADVINSSIKLSKLDISEQAVIKLLTALEVVIVLYLGALLVIDNVLTVGMLIAFIAYKNMFSDSAYKLVDKVFELKLLGLHIERLSDITLHRVELDIDCLANENVGDSLKGSLEISNLSFRYSSSTDWIFEGVSFLVEPGESGVLVGPSGCGKSTILKSLLRIIQCEEGGIFFNGVDINKFSLKEYRSKIGSVMQDDVLLSGTILENITMFESNYDEEHYLRCCDIACLTPVLSDLPMGGNTLVGDMGSTLSGGQIQRILIARALYIKPDILVLDEATSNLDSDILNVINDNISKLNITRVQVAHRAETIESACRVIELY